MCTGLEIALILGATGLSVAGTSMANREAQENNARIAEARNRELAATLARNEEIAQDSRDVFFKRQQEIQPDEINARQDKLTADRTANLEEAIVPKEDDSIPIRGNSPSIVKSEIARKMLEATKEATANAQRMGTLGGYGDLWFDQGIADTAAGRDIGVNANFIKGNMGILPFSQDFAEYQAYRPSSGVGEIMQGVGNVIGSFAGSGKAPKSLMPAKTSMFPVPMA